MSYGRMDINLLPPELKPGPAVRYAMIFNVLIIAGTLTYILLDAFLGVTRLSYARQERVNLQGQLEQNSMILADYNQLISIRDRLANYGRLIGLASADYVDIPVLLDRIAHILPPGVYLERVTNDANSGGSQVPVTISLRASRRDAKLVLSALNAFKNDSLFAECYMPGLTADEQPLNELMQQSGITWSSTSPDLPPNIVAEEFSFQINAKVPRKLEGVSLPVALDHSIYFSGMTLPAGKPATPGSTAPPNNSAGAGGTGQTPPTAPPPGVEVTEVH